MERINAIAKKWVNINGIKKYYEKHNRKKSIVDTEASPLGTETGKNLTFFW
jgi:hypothetical protein